jgi:hypothetical protein
VPTSDTTLYAPMIPRLEDRGGSPGAYNILITSEVMCTNIMGHIIIYTFPRTSWCEQNTPRYVHHDIKNKNKLMIFARLSLGKAETARASERVPTPTPFESVHRISRYHGISIGYQRDIHDMSLGIYTRYHMLGPPRVHQSSSE